MKLLARAVLPVAAAAFLLAGCTSTQDGTASPANSAPPVSSAEGSPSTDSGSASTTSLEPCSLLTVADVAGYASSFDDAVEEKLGGARLCSYQKKTASASEEGLTIGVAIRDDASVDQTNDTGNGVKDLQVNGRKAKEASSAVPLGCTVALGVGDKARVDVNVTAVDTVDKACQIAEEVATKAVEPKLPKG